MTQRTRRDPAADLKKPAQSATMQEKIDDAKIIKYLRLAAQSICESRVHYAPNNELKAIHRADMFEAIAWLDSKEPK